MYASHRIKDAWVKAKPQWAAMLLAVLLLAPWQGALAACITFDGSSTVTFNVASPVNVPPNAQVGDVIFQTAGVTPTPVVQLICGGTTDYGVTSQIGTSSGNAVFPTGTAGIGFRIMEAGAWVYPYGNSEFTGSRTLNTPAVLQLVKTGPITSKATLSSVTLGRWVYQGIFGTATGVTYVLGSSITFSGACQATMTNIAVALPRISTTSLPSVDSTAGSTPFRIALNCSSGAKLNVQFDPGTATVTGKPTVMTSTGSAGGVGLQLTDSASGVVNFGAPKPVGVTPNGPLELQYNARYYRTGAVSAGTVNATATFTLSYD